MSFSIFQIDAFACRPFDGNPACVCLLHEEKSDEWMQQFASEMNLSETAFVWKQNDGFRLRWFTPLVEVKLCGHATMAAAKAIWSAGWLATDSKAVFHTLSGQLVATKAGDQITLDFPAKNPVACEPPPGLLDALKVEASWVGTDGTDFMVVAESEHEVRNVTPDFPALRMVAARGIIVTSSIQNGEHDFVSRFFAPAVGIDEDPVTGSAHCILAPYWSEKLGIKEMKAFQASSRGGELNLRINDGRVFLSGNAVTVFQGQSDI